jgi:hypothetical protein
MIEKQVTVENGILKTVELDNGLKLNVMDNSRGLIGDRWYVSIIARIDVFVDMVFQSSDGTDAILPDDIKQLLGDSVRFEKKMERHFIDQKEKDDIKQGLENSLIESLLPYLSHPEFPKRFVITEYVKAKQKSTWQPEN